MTERPTYLLAVDLGTHGARVLCVDQEGRIHGRGREVYHRRITAGGVQEQDLEQVRRALWRAVRQTVEQISDPTAITGMTVTHQRGTLVGLDKSGQPVGPAVCDGDTRSWPQAHQLAERIGAERLFRTTGCPPVAFNGLTKMIWVREEQPDLYSRVKTWASMQDWAVHLLSGELRSSPGSALRLGVLNIQKPEEYAEDVLREAGIPVQQLMPLHSMGAEIGRLTAEAAGGLGLPAGIPIYPAPGDQPAAVLGTGAVADGYAAVNLGTSFLTSIPVQRTDALFREAGEGKFTLEILAGDLYALELGSGAGTNVLDWMRTDLFGLESVEDLNQLLEESPSGDPGPLVVPHWWSALSDRKGLITGIEAGHSRADLLRATYQGLVYEVRWAWDELTDFLGFQPQKTALFGGASQNDFLCQLLADVLQVSTYRVETSEASAFGAAVSTAAAKGWYPDVFQAAEQMVRWSRVFQPEQVSRDSYQRYLELREGFPGES